MGGEAFAIKHLKPPSNLAADMLLNAGLNSTDNWRWMKMACGENIRGRSHGKMPATRLGEAWLFRERFEKAQELKIMQDDWVVHN
jgi:hypothetical protein